MAFSLLAALVLAALSAEDGSRSSAAAQEASQFPLEVAEVGAGVYAGLLDGAGVSAPFARSREESKALVREALQASFGKNSRYDLAIPLLVYAYRQIEADKALSASERETLRLQLRSRMITLGDRIIEEIRNQRAARERADSRAKTEAYLAKSRAKKSRAATLAGESGEPEPLSAPDVPSAADVSSGPGYSNDFTLPPSLHPASGGAPGGGAEEEGEALVELIRSTIAPDTWDVNGGPGSISYYKPLKVLVIRQTGEIHWLIGGFRRALEK